MATFNEPQTSSAGQSTSPRRDAYLASRVGLDPAPGCNGVSTSQVDLLLLQCMNRLDSTLQMITQHLDRINPPQVVPPPTHQRDRWNRSRNAQSIAQQRARVASTGRSHPGSNQNRVVEAPTYEPGRNLVNRGKGATRPNDPPQQSNLNRANFS